MPERTELNVALCQIATLPGDVPGNVARIASSLKAAFAAGADVAITPELALLGYPARDLLERTDLVRALGPALAELADLVPDDRLAAVGTVGWNAGPGRPLRNALALLSKGRAPTLLAKRLLPDYDVFEETRHFEPGGPTAVVPFRGHRLGFAICEDFWAGAEATESGRYRVDPPCELAESGADLILGASASPFWWGKAAHREAVLGAAARRAGRPIAVCGAVGGHEELLFDGASTAHDANGRLLARGRQFAEDLVLVRFPGGGVVHPATPDPVTELESALIFGIASYVERTGFSEILLGSSGGIDSAVLAILARKALGPDRVRTVALPSRHSSPGSVTDAAELARRLGIRHEVQTIEPAYVALHRSLEEILGPAPFGLLEENLQARIRGTILMGISNRTGALLLTTSNKSEAAVGYSTLYGDMCGGLAPLADVYKTEVYALGRRHREEGWLPEACLTKPPSAELAPGQRDSDSLPPYEDLDRILQHHIEGGLGPRDVARRLPEISATEIARVLRLVARSEFKRQQAAPALKVSRKAFGIGRRIPIVKSDLDWARERYLPEEPGDTTTDPPDPRTPDPFWTSL